MAITLLDNSNSILSSYQKGWELALKVFEEETSGKQVRTRTSKKKNS
jgi:hypothetical protein